MMGLKLNHVSKGAAGNKVPDDVSNDNTPVWCIYQTQGHN